SGPIFEIFVATAQLLGESGAVPTLTNLANAYVTADLSQQRAHKVTCVQNVVVRDIEVVRHGVLPCELIADRVSVSHVTDLARIERLNPKPVFRNVHDDPFTEQIQEESKVFVPWLLCFLYEIDLVDVVFGVSYQRQQGDRRLEWLPINADSNV